jgi:hypothetical protein
MKPFLFTLATAVLAVSGQAQAGEFVKPHYPVFGCGGFCINMFGRLHQHGPLFNYGPYSGYYPFEPYGPWTSDLKYNPPMPAAGCSGDGCHGGGRVAWGRYAASTLANVLHRLNPFANRGGCKLNGGACSSACALPAECATAAPVQIPEAPCVAVQAAPTAPACATPVTMLPAIAPIPVAPVTPVAQQPATTSGATAVLTGRVK